MSTTTTLVKPESNSHWYDKDGKPRHDATLREARKEKLYPSVTTVLQEIAKPSLESWKVNQAVLSALTLPRVEGESEDDYAKRVVEDSKQHSIKAAEFGTRIHAGCESFLEKGYHTTDFADVLPYLSGFSDWHRNNLSEVIATEKVVVHPGLGYAGRVDLIAVHKTHGLCIIDLKTQGIKEGKKAAFYPEFLWQLVAYGQCPVPKSEPAYEAITLRQELNLQANLISLVINSTKPEPVVEKVWPVEDYQNAWEIFKSALNIWKRKRNYSPVEGV